MTHARTVLEIGRWEFSRWFKLRGLFITLGLSVLFSAALAGGRYLMERSSRSPVKIGVVNAEHLPWPSESPSRISFHAISDTTAAQIEAALLSRTYDGVLILRGPDPAELVVERHVAWEAELRELLTAEQRRSKLALLKVTPDELSEALAPARLVVVYRQAARGPGSVAEKVASAVLIVLMLIGIFNSVAYQLVGITGEKQLRVTEQIVSAVTPQQWIDGKILGISAYSAVQTGVFAFSTVAFLVIMGLFGESLPVPVEVTSASNILMFMLFAVGGFLFWNTCIAAFAATINDPNTSSRSALLFLPLLPSIGAGLAAMKMPDSLVSQVLTLLPITSPVAVPVRLVMIPVPAWEMVLAFVILAVSTWYARLLAGRVFRLGMLMYGKEPNARELWRWLRET